MDPTLIATLCALALFPGMLGLLELGRRMAVRRAAANPELPKPSVGALEGAIFGLLGLLLAFTFSGAASRFDTRRELIVEEANDIGTAYRRLDLLPAAAQPALRDAFRRYVDSRLAVYSTLTDMDAATAELARSNAIQDEIWSKCVAAGHDIPPPFAALLFSALNQMIDITTTRTMATRIHPPVIIFVMLFVLALASSLIAGYGMGDGRRSRLHTIVFAAVMSVTIYVILDLEYPRMGLFSVRAFDQVLVDVRQGMN